MTRLKATANKNHGLLFCHYCVWVFGPNCRLNGSPLKDVSRWDWRRLAVWWSVREGRLRCMNLSACTRPLYLCIRWFCPFTPLYLCIDTSSWRRWSPSPPRTTSAFPTWPATPSVSAGTWRRRMWAAWHTTSSTWAARRAGTQIASNTGLVSSNLFYTKPQTTLPLLSSSPPLRFLIFQIQWTVSRWILSKPPSTSTLTIKRWNEL